MDLALVRKPMILRSLEIFLADMRTFLKGVYNSELRDYVTWVAVDLETLHTAPEVHMTTFSEKWICGTTLHTIGQD